MDCIVKNCENKSHQGGGLYLTPLHNYETIWICFPCLDAVVCLYDNWNPQYSQVYRNIIKKYKELENEK